MNTQGLYNHEDYFVDAASEIVSDDYKDMFDGNGGNIVNLPRSLQEYQINRQILLINGVYVSIKRLLDNLGKCAVMDSLTIFYAIIYKTYYTLDEIEALRDALMPEVKDIKAIGR